MKVPYNQYINDRNFFNFPDEFGSVGLNDTSNPGSFGWMLVPKEDGIYHRTVGPDYVLYATTGGRWWYCIGDSQAHVVDGYGSDLTDAQRKCERSVLLAVLSCLEFFLA